MISLDPGFHRGDDFLRVHRYSVSLSFYKKVLLSQSPLERGWLRLVFFFHPDILRWRFSKYGHI